MNETGNGVQGNKLCSNRQTGSASPTVNDMPAENARDAPKLCKNPVGPMVYDDLNIRYASPVNPSANVPEKTSIKPAAHPYGVMNLQRSHEKQPLRDD